MINTSDGLILTGFYLKSDADVTISASKGQLEISTRTIASTQDRWIYYSLKEWGEITSITLSSKGNVYIDNFSGNPQELIVTADDKTVSEGESVILTSDVSGGVSPYTYNLRNSKNEILSTEEQYSFVPQECGDYTLTVTDAWDETATITVRVIVTGEAAAATFENLYLDSESYWMGDPEESMSSFVSGSYKFSNYYEPDYATWAYFGYSNVTSTVYNPADFPSKVDDTAGVYIVPAFTGLGAPYWDMYARGAIVGLTRGANRNHIIRAAQEAIAYQTKDVLDAMIADTGLEIQELRVDGGASRSDFLMQFQSDIMGRSLRRPMIRETTALGAAYLAGLATGAWDSLQQIKELWAIDKVYTPNMEADCREGLLKGWKKAVTRAKDWAED